MTISDRFAPSPAARRPLLPSRSAAEASEEVRLSAYSQLQSCPTAAAAGPLGRSLARQARALAEPVALQAGGGPAQASTSELLAQFRQGLCPYLAQATQNTPGDWSALDLLRQGLETQQLDAVDFLQDVHAHYGPSVQVGDVLFESRPEVAQEIMTLTDHKLPEKDKFSKSSLQRQAMGGVYGDHSLFLETDESWQQRRALLQPFFTGQRVLSAENHSHLQALTRAHFDRLARGLKDDPVVDMNLKLRALSLDVALQHIFSVKLEPSELESMAQVFDRAGDGIQNRFLGVGSDRAALDQELDTVAERLLDGRKPGQARSDALQALLDSPLGKDPQRLRAEVLTLAMLGHETTGNLLTWSLGELSRQPERIAAMRSEYAQEIGAAPPTLEQTQDLGVNRAVVKETTRLHAPNYLVSRQAKQDVELETAQGPLRIAAGTQVLMAVQELNQDPEYWTDPATWNPDREGSRMYSFGGGARVCLGQVLARLELNVVLSQLVQRFDLEALGGLDPSSDFSTRPADGRFRVTERTVNS